jgi:hypothetical protein
MLVLVVLLVVVRLFQVARIIISCRMTLHRLGSINNALYSSSSTADAVTVTVAVTPGVATRKCSKVLLS